MNRFDPESLRIGWAHLAAILKIMHDEDLLRFRRRLEKAGYQQTAELLTLEIEKRKAFEKQEQSPLRADEPKTL